MSQPKRDDRTINAGLEQGECHGVAKQVDGDPFSLEGTADTGGVCGVFGEHVLDAVNTQPIALHVWEKQSSVATWRLTQPRLQNSYRGLCQRRAALLAAFALCTAPKLRGYKGASVLEVVDDFDGDTFRAVYTVRFAEVIYVLHAFQKKSKRGIATPKHELDLINERLRRAKEDYERWQSEKPKSG